MIPIKYFWSKDPNEGEIREALNIVENENCVVIIKWRIFGGEYSMTVTKGMTFEECKRLIPTVYGL